MMEEFDRYLNCNNHLRENLGLFIDAFVEFYGEERREEVVTKLSKVIPIAYMSPETMVRTIEEIRKTINEELFNKLKESIPSIFDKEDLLDFYKFDDMKFSPIMQFKEFYDSYNLGEEGRIERYKENSLATIQSSIPTFTKEEYEEIIRTKTIPEKYDKLPNFYKNNILFYAELNNVDKAYNRQFSNVKKILQKIDPNVSLDNVGTILENEEIKKILQYIEILPDYTNEYNSLMSKYDPFVKEIKENEDLKTKLRDEYFIKYLEENKDLLNEEDLKSIEKKKTEKFASLSSRINTYFGYGLSSPGKIEAFSSEAERIINSEEDNWRKNSIIDDRISFFKANGIDLGNNYEDYINNENVKQIIPSMERVDKIVESKTRLLNEFNNLFYTNTTSHKQVRSEINQFNLMDKEDGFDADIYDGCGKTFICPNVIHTENGYDTLSLMVISCNSREGTVDHNICHELNHLFELCLLSADENSNSVISGWDSSSTIYDENYNGIVNLNEKREKRSYELFSEIINEKIAQEIYTKMLEKDIHVFDTKENAQVKNTTSYENTAFLVNEFFNEFKEEIIQSRSNGNIEIIWNKVGKENFDALNELFKIFNENFQGFNYYGAIKDIQENIQSDRAMLLANLHKQKDQIMENMRNYALINSVDNQVMIL